MPEPDPHGVITVLTSDHQRRELSKEALTMALYVAICLLAGLVAVPESTAEAHVGEIVWGTTLGLALAHWFAFRVSARLVAAGTVRRQDALAAAAQGVGALAVALLATLPLLVLPVSIELEVVELLLAAFIALVGYSVARVGGATGTRSVAYGIFLLAAAGVVVAIKILLSGH